MRIFSFATSVAIAALTAGALASGTFDARAEDARPGPSRPGAQGVIPDSGPAAKPAPGENKQAEAVEPPTLDQLFAELKAARTPGAARRIATDIETRWSDTGSETIDYLLMQASQALKVNSGGLSLDLLDAAIALKPDCAEAWNRRAAVHFARKEFDQAIEDVEVTLRLEPRQWNAMVGLANMMDDMERKKEALDLLRRAREIYPLLQDLDKKIDELSLEVEGRKA